MNLLKIGTLNIPRNRWEDSLKVFDSIYVFCMEDEKEIDNSNVIYVKFKQSNVISRLLSKLFFRIARKYRGNRLILAPSISILRVLNKKLVQQISNYDFEYVHSSYNDFDESGILTMLLAPYIKNKNITRAYKENRPEKNYIEEFNFNIANRIVLNSKENEEYFKEKHESIKWDEKEIITDLDEDYRNSEIINNVILEDKLSSIDGKKHIVILAGRVMSDNLDKRSGMRLYYIPLINELIEAGLVVHLHTMKIINDKNGDDQYEILREKYKTRFHIEGPLDFENNPIEAYRTLSKYDFGILHNISKDNNYVSVFDKVNIPHRFYEYQIAEVVPILRARDTVLMERLFNEYNCGIIYENLEDIMNCDYEKIKFIKKSFYYYINELYGKI